MQTEIVTEPIIEDVTKSEILAVESWNRERTDDELQSFISRHIQAVGNLALEGIEIA
jgi:hypothetical protein